MEIDSPVFQPVASVGGTPIRLAFAGQARSGKDSMAMCVNEQVPNVQRMAFADSVKDSVTHLFGISREDIEYWKPQDGCPPGCSTPMRQILQFIGDGARQHVRDNVWVNKIDAMITEQPISTSIVITDVRYENELQMLRSHGFTVVLVGRQSTFLTTIVHSSETYFHDLTQWTLRNTTAPVVNMSDCCDCPSPGNAVDYFVRNDGSLATLAQTTYQLLSTMHRRG